MKRTLACLGRCLEKTLPWYVLWTIVIILAAFGAVMSATGGLAGLLALTVAELLAILAPWFTTWVLGVIAVSIAAFMKCGRGCV